ncbi:MAG: ASCH domain-containing protein [Planctomycetaceae bacterium]|nr:ASCH domain-containing protein [Planctomycetaceae bacterium]
MLLFKKKFIEPILLGDKTQTIRLWRYRRMRTGQRSYIPGVGYIMIDSVDPIRLDELTDADARLDGFPDATSLQAELQILYAEELQRGFQAFRVRFTRLPEKEQQRIKLERKKQKESLKDKIRVEQYEKTMKKLREIAK